MGAFVEAPRGSQEAVRRLLRGEEVRRLPAVALPRSGDRTGAFTGAPHVDSRGRPRSLLLVYVLLRERDAPLVGRRAPSTAQHGPARARPLPPVRALRHVPGLRRGNIAVVLFGVFLTNYTYYQHQESG